MLGVAANLPTSADNTREALPGMARRGTVQVMADEQDLSTGTDLPPRWVLASPGDTPLAGRAIGWSELLGDLDRLVEARRAAGESYELVEVAGADAAAFPVSGEGPRYWESLHPADSYLGSISDHVEVYRRGGELLVVDDSGPGSP